MDRTEDAIALTETLNNKLHICNFCTNSFNNTCPYSDRISAADKIYEEMINNETIKNEIVNRLGPNPFEGNYTRINASFGPICSCDDYNGILEGRYYNNIKTN